MCRITTKIVLEADASFNPGHIAPIGIGMPDFVRGDGGRHSPNSAVEPVHRIDHRDYNDMSPTPGKRQERLKEDEISSAQLIFYGRMNHDSARL